MGGVTHCAPLRSPPAAARLQPSPNPPGASPLPSPLPSPEITAKGETNLPVLNLPGTWEAETGRPFSLSPGPPPTPSAARTVQRCLRCPFFALPMRGAAGSPTRGSVALRWGVGKLQSRFSTARLCCGTACGAEPSQPHALLPTRSRKNSAFTTPCLWPRGVLPPRDPRGPWPVPSEGSGARCSSPAPPGAPAAFSDLGSESHFLYAIIFFFFFFSCNCL